MAPCEQVCPVEATVHSTEGLNDMVYNRCVGTRYCSNNCPYKVRRFNFFNYHKDLEDPANEVLKMAYNPRGHGPQPRGDGEVHLLRAADPGGQDRGQEPPRRPIRDGEIVTACQQACPTQAHRLRRPERHGERRWPGSADSPRAYSMLAELNTKPRTIVPGAGSGIPIPELERSDA